MKIVVIDAQGGGLGKGLISAIRKRYPNEEIIAVGTNSLATSNMLKGSCDIGATGENAVIVNCRDADIIVGPVGIVIADALYGEITPAMALAVSQSRAVRILLPINRCNNLIVGVDDLNTSTLIEKALEMLARYLSD